MKNTYKYIKIKVIFSSLLLILVINNLNNNQNLDKILSLVRRNRLLEETTATLTANNDEKIPRTLWVNVHNQLGKNNTIDRMFNSNIANIINKYSDNDNTLFEVKTLSTQICKEAISKVQAVMNVTADVDLLKYFILEDPQRYICRLAVLYLYGGYYVQRDIKIIEPYIASSNDDYSFVGITSLNTSIFDGSFIASTSKNSMLHFMLEKYCKLSKGEELLTELEEIESSTTPTQMIPKDKFSMIMRSSYKDILNAQPNSKYDIKMLYVEKLDNLQNGNDNEYNLIRKQNGKGKYCDYVIIDKSTKKTYFYALLPGASPSQCDKVKPTIPHKIWFASKYELSKLKESNHKHFDNIQNTITLYKNALNTDNDIEYEILDYKACMNIVTNFQYSILFELFMKGFHKNNDNNNDQKHGYKGFDICRIIVLYENGGYFFNDEVNVVEPFVPTNNEISFIGVVNPSGLFLSSFIAASPKNSIINDIISKYILLAQKKLSMTTNNIAGEIYLDAYHKNIEEDSSKTASTTSLLVEKHLTEMDEVYDVKSKQTFICNFVISDPKSKKIKFFTRFYAFGEDCVDAED